jgi:intracellular sulfur oxidation DsrE/DsrF family protein
MLLKKNDGYADRLKEAADKGVILAACQNTMRAMNVKTEDLFPFAVQVDAGVAELVRKQEAGWAYIKGGE